MIKFFRKFHAKTAKGHTKRAPYVIFLYATGLVFLVMTLVKTWVEVTRSYRPDYDAAYFITAVALVQAAFILGLWLRRKWGAYGHMISLVLLFVGYIITLNIEAGLRLCVYCFILFFVLKSEWPYLK